MIHQLTDTQLAQFTASGVIVVDGERTRFLVPAAPGKRHTHWDETLVAPELWRKLTEPCATCRGRDWVYVEGSTITADKDRRCPNPDCDRGRQVVTLETLCDEEGNHDYHHCHVIPGGNGLLYRTLGRFTIRLLPVVGDPDNWPTEPSLVVLSRKRVGGRGNAHCLTWIMDGVGIYRPIDLDPLPQPGQWAVQFEAVA